MNSKHRKTLKAIFSNPILSNIPWKDIEAMIEATGAKKSEGAGSRVRFLLNGVPGMFHRPHPQKETDKGAVESVRKFLIDAGIEP
ncbi:type II toxin-antitoxin system HicA family toxin [Sulfurirhabdus autotrophica]|nr:type II toxin-antitoxin system HicA family toxin [Sulfurirhabdus autotrophica]